ncbi:MAG: hypothetical protein JNM34_07140, partial [Chthonomonadaceae bacterium]|nr:hypothetical protein [Chthonomonadaceae bacterium]
DAQGTAGRGGPCGDSGGDPASGGEPDRHQGREPRHPAGVLCRAAVAAGADGLIIEVHPNPDHAIKDGPQSMTIPQFVDMVPTLVKVAEAIGRHMATGVRAN